MTWDYLPNMDKRYEEISLVIKDYVPNKIIVDLDCLEARLLNYIPNTYSKYIGNDILDKFPKDKVNTEFYLQPDDKFSEIVDKCDILVLTGHGGYEIDGNENESKTLSKSFISIMTKCEPDILVLESVFKYEPIIITLPDINYNLLYHSRLVLGNEWTSMRAIYIYKRKL